MAERSKILIIGGTGYTGKFIVEASANAGHPTFVLVRESTLSDPSKSSVIDCFKKAGVNIITGDLHDNERLITAIKQVDVVISAVGLSQLADQVKIVAAIKEAGNIKKFYPSEFGNDVDRSHAVGPAKTLFATKAQVRRAIEAENIPYTYIHSNCFAGYLLPTLAQSGVTAPPRDKVVSLGDGNAKAVFNEEHDIATYTIKTVDDPRTVNKSVYINPPGNIYSFNELVSLWEKKIGKTLEKVYLSEDQVLKNIEGKLDEYYNKISYFFSFFLTLNVYKLFVLYLAESPFPDSLIMSISHTVFVKGDQTNFEIEPSFGVEASELYPDVKYTTVDEHLSRFV
ncbi:putative NmrA-like domain, NAD(P)-binding domain superfamily [Helianthus debilis subsp. tardiflorus]